VLADSIELFVPSEFLVKPACHAWELAEAHRLRRAVFCLEQGIFTGDDLDAIDASAQTLVAATCVAGMPDQVVGTVRIHASEPGLWWGSRLAVHPAFRSQGQIGSTLIRLAVGLARLYGAIQFRAHVQSQNVALFEKLHWTLLEEVVLHGRPHGLMEAGLDFYPGERRFVDGIVTRARSRQ
jgi:putative N-acetyltransferase (TIGR04045 family)